MRWGYPANPLRRKALSVFTLCRLADKSVRVLPCEVPQVTQFMAGGLDCLSCCVQPPAPVARVSAPFRTEAVFAASVDSAALPCPQGSVALVRPRRSIPICKKATSSLIKKTYGANMSQAAGEAALAEAVRRVLAANNTASVGVEGGGGSGAGGSNFVEYGALPSPSVPRRHRTTSSRGWRTRRTSPRGRCLSSGCGGLVRRPRTARDGSWPPIVS